MCRSVGHVVADCRYPGLQLDLELDCDGKDFPALRRVAPALPRTPSERKHILADHHGGVLSMSRILANLDARRPNTIAPIALHVTRVGGAAAVCDCGLRGFEVPCQCPGEGGAA